MHLDPWINLYDISNRIWTTFQITFPFLKKHSINNFSSYRFQVSKKSDGFLRRPITILSYLARQEGLKRSPFNGLWAARRRVIKMPPKSGRIFTLFGRMGLIVEGKNWKASFKYFCIAAVLLLQLSNPAAPTSGSLRKTTCMNKLFRGSCQTCWIGRASCRLLRNFTVFFLLLSPVNQILRRKNPNQGVFE